MHTHLHTHTHTHTLPPKSKGDIFGRYTDYQDIKCRPIVNSTKHEVKNITTDGIENILWDMRTEIW